MGEVARLGISGGRAVPIESLLDDAEHKNRVINFVVQLCEEYDRLKLIAPSLVMTRYSASVGPVKFSDVAAAIVDREPLDDLMARRLLGDAPLPLLMKLVELHRCVQWREPPADESGERATGHVLSPRPIVMVPLERWIWQELERYPSNDSALLTSESEWRVIRKAISFLDSVEHHTVRVIFDDIPWERLLQERRGAHGCSYLARMLSEIAECREGLVLHGPSVEHLVSCVWRADAFKGEILDEDMARADHLIRDLEIILQTLKTLGFSGLRSASSLEAMKLVRDMDVARGDAGSDPFGNGFGQSLITFVDKFSSCDELVVELCAISQIAREKGGLQVWVPGWSNGELRLSGFRPRRPHRLVCGGQDDVEGVPSSLKQDICITHAARDYRLLRVLAVGSLFLNNVPYKRASSRFLSLEGLQMAYACGANEFGFGAYDHSTAQSLQLHHLDDLPADMRLASHEPHDIPEQ